jgi:hypothetical protein
VAWAAVWPDDGDGVDCNWIYSSREDAEWAASGGDHIDGRRGVGTVVPLYREPKPTLTEQEREFLQALRDAYQEMANQTGSVNAAVQADSRKNAAIIRGLLERTK